MPLRYGVGPLISTLIVLGSAVRFGFVVLSFIEITAVVVFEILIPWEHDPELNIHQHCRNQIPTGR